MKIKITFSEYTPSDRAQLIDLLRKSPDKIAFLIDGEVCWEQLIESEKVDSTKDNKIKYILFSD